jgi:nitrogen regulatory protein PII
MARSSQIVFVLPIEQVLRVRTGERDEAAI